MTLGHRARPSRAADEPPIDPLPVLDAWARITGSKGNRRKLAFAVHMRDVAQLVIEDLESEGGPGRPGVRPGR